MIKREITSFSNAARGFATALQGEPHMRFHIVMSLAVMLTAWWRDLSITQYCILLLTIALVFLAELINTAFEIMCDHVTPEYDENIRKIKDVAAGAVLVASAFAVIIGLLMIVPTF